MYCIMNRKVYTSIHPLVGVGVSGLKSLFLSLLFFGIHQASFGQCNLHVPVPLACNDNVQISLDDNGTALVLPDHILEGTYDLQFYSVSITAPSGAPVANPLTCANIGQTLNVKVTDICTNNYCTGTITVEDNLPPTLVCQDVVTHCAVTNFSPAYLSGVLGIANANPVAFDNCEID